MMRRNSRGCFSNMVYQISELDPGAWRPQMQEILQSVETMAWGHTGQRSDQRWEPMGA